MLPVLYTPVPSDGVAVLLRAHGPAADEVARLLARLARLRPLRVTAAHHPQPRPRLPTPDPFGVGDDRDPAPLGAAVPLLLLGLVRLALDLLVVHRGAQALHDVVVEVSLVLLHRQDVIAASLD